MTDDYQELWDFVESDKPFETGDQAVRLFCILNSWVSNETDATTFPSVSSDCFCADSKMLRMERERGYEPGFYFRNSGDAFRAIANAVRVVTEKKNDG